MSRIQSEPASLDPLAALVASVVAREPRAIDALVRAASPAALRVVRQVLGAQHPDVGDVVQEAVFAAVEALDGFRGECTVLHFVCRVAALTAMNARRRLRLREQITSETESLDEYPSDEPTPFGHTLARKRRAAFRQLLDELPAVQSEVLALHCVLGFTVAETAAATSVPLNTVRSRLLAAKASLRDRLSEDHELWELVRGAS
jgi:RNA polymerase sigma-70 factor (ECF subfamily)